MLSALRLLFTYIGVTAALSTQPTPNNATTLGAFPQGATTLDPTSQPSQLASPPRPTIDLGPPLLLGFRIDHNKTQYNTGKIVIPPDKTTVILYGLRLDDIVKIEINHGSCHGGKSKEPPIESKSFVRHLHTLIEFSHDFALGSYVICAKTSSGSSVKFAEDRSIDVIAPIVEERAYKLHWLSLQIVALVLLHVLSAFFSGLSLGLMTLTVRELEIIAKSGSEKEQRYAMAILPLRRKGNQLLCTLLLGNTLCNASISIFLEDLLHPIIGDYTIIAATTTMLLLGEILPQSICVNNALATGARMMLFAKICMYLFSLFAWPISKVLDWFVGEEHESYDRKRLMELMNRVIANNPDMVNDELQIAAGAMNLKRKSVQESMTPIEEVFMLPETATLNSSAIAAIVRAGYTRIPVFRAGNKKDICDVLITKDLALIDPDDNYTVRMLCNIYKHPIPRMRSDMTLFIALQIFRKGEDGHLAVVYEHDETNIIGIISLEDVVEEILQEEIKDEFDLKREKRGHEKILWDTAPPPAVMPKQLQTVTYQFCVANEEAFKERYLERSIFRRLMSSCTRNVDVNYLKPLGGALTVPIKQLPRCARLYTKDEMSDRYILILEGRAEVTIGQGGMKFEAGPFHRFGQELLQKLMQNADELCKRPAESAVDSKQLMQFKPDFSVAVFEDCTFMEVTADMYIKALRMTRLQRQTKAVQGDANTAAAFGPDFKATPPKGPDTSQLSLASSKEKMALSLAREEVKKPSTGPSVPVPATPLSTAAAVSNSQTQSTESNRTLEGGGANPPGK